jgi:hypothetical protein
MTHIVVLVWHVIMDLRVFLFSYFLFIFIISQLYAVLGLGNEYEVDIDESEYLEPTDDDPERHIYFAIGLHAGCFLWTLRLSMGDFSIIKPVSKLSYSENILFWLVYVLTLYVSCIFFLNFIVVEANATYQRVLNHLEELIYKEKAIYIKEAENMTNDAHKKASHFPRYLIQRRNDS